MKRLVYIWCEFQTGVGGKGFSRLSGTPDEPKFLRASVATASSSSLGGSGTPPSALSGPGVFLQKVNERMTSYNS